MDLPSAYVSFVDSGKSLAASRGLVWDFLLDKTGFSSDGWNLTQIVGGLPPNFYLQDLGQDEKTLALQRESNCPNLLKTPLRDSWQDLIKAATCEQLLFKRNTPGHVFQNIIRPLKVLASCAGSLEPWQLTADVAREAILVAKQIQASGKLADLIAGVIKNVIDINHLAENSPLYPALSIVRLPNNTNRKSKEAKSIDQMRDSLEERKRAERLPEKRAFWELIRIIFTEKPKTFGDKLRFSALEGMVLTGLRLGESVMLPADWARYREHYDPKGRPAGDLGGFSKTLMVRHFAEKQQEDYSDSTVLIENAQHVPNIFVDILTSNLNEAVRITQPLRDTLKRQVETERIFPHYDVNELVPVVELYPQLTGNPFWLNMDKNVREEFIEKYRDGYNPNALHELARYQSAQFSGAGAAAQLDMAIYMYFNRLVNRDTKNLPALSLRDANGQEYSNPRKKWRDVFLCIGELEQYIKVATPTKLSDVESIKLATGQLQSWELMYLTPKRALSEERNDGISDIARYSAVGMPSDMLLLPVLGQVKQRQESLFMRYGQSDEDRTLTLESLMLRHLQNSELFKLGVADTIITKRFNRRSVAQSYEYDHRSLSEDLESIDIPDELEAFLGDKSTTVAKLIKAGKASGPIVAMFKRIQREQGDEVAFNYLKAEADGFHATPYGHCINSFTVDPCPKNLECFAGCGQLTATNLPENRRHLSFTEVRLEAALSEVQASPPGRVGRKNQIAHAIIRLEGVRKLLATPTGSRVFPDGPDFSVLTRSKSVLDD